MFLPESVQDPEVIRPGDMGVHLTRYIRQGNSRWLAKRMSHSACYRHRHGQRKNKGNFSTESRPLKARVTVERLR